MILGNAVVAGDGDSVDDGLLALFDFEGDIEFGFVVDDARSYFDVLVAFVVVEGLQVGDALLEKFLADAAVAEDAGFLDHDLGEEIGGGDGVVAVEEDGVDFVFLAAVDFVDEGDLIGLAGGVDFYGDVEVSLFLEVVDKILLAFLDEVGVDGALGIDGDEFFHLASGEKGDTREFCAGGADGDDGSEFNFERDFDTIGGGVVVRRIFVHAAGEAALAREFPLDEGDGTFMFGV